MHEAWELTQLTRIAAVISGEGMVVAENPFSEAGATGFAAGFAAASNGSGSGHSRQRSSLLNQCGARHEQGWTGR